MSSGMTGQTPCPGRWDKTAQNVSNAAPNSGQSAQAGDGAVSSGGAEKAAAMAAKINAMLMAKGKLMTPGSPMLSKKQPIVPVPVVDDMVVTEVEINDVPIYSRDMLTKGKIQEEIRQFSGAVVTTKGHYMADAEKEKVAGHRPLYLQVQGKTQEQVNKAVFRINEIISEDMWGASAAARAPPPVMPPVPVYLQAPRSATQEHRPAPPHTGSFVHTKIFVGLNVLPSFDVKKKIEGPSGAYLGHIQTETGARVFLRGKGSRYIEQLSKRESFEPLHVYISHPNEAGLEAAKKLSENLLATVRAEHARLTAGFGGPSPTTTYASHGYPPNTNYSNQGSWYTYPANAGAGYAGTYPTAYPTGYWSNANGGPSQSNQSTVPPSPQAMVQYPMCPRQPQPYDGQVPDSAEKVEAEGSVNAPDVGSPNHQLPLESKLKPPTPKSSECPAPVSKCRLMPPPQLKRAREPDPPAQRVSAPPGDRDENQVKKTKVSRDALGLVPYGGDSSDEEEETYSSKT